MEIRVGVRDCDNPSLLKKSTEIGFYIKIPVFSTIHLEKVFIHGNERIKF